MSADAMGVVLMVAMVPAVTLYPILYLILSPWPRTLVSRSLVMSSIGLALLVDIAVAYAFLGDDYAARDVVRLTVFSIILVGAWMQLIALIVEKARAYRSRRRAD